MSGRLRAIARETVADAERGAYRNPAGTEIAIGADVRHAIAGTRLHLPGDDLVVPDQPPVTPAVHVTDESTLASTRRLGGDVACLVFASARNPGGGFLNGAQAQEESVARGSALYPCLLAAGDFYAHHRAAPELTYTDRVVYSPAVPVFRDDKGEPLAAPYPVTFLTCAAPNAAAIARTQPEHLDAVPSILARRATRALSVAAAHGHRRLVLGAWGCGVFGNDPVVVAGAFGQALAARPFFDEVVFAIYDRGRESATRAAFAQVFDSGA
jgi:uncharacterized protein (TIGR02452 family)